MNFLNGYGGRDETFSFSIPNEKDLMAVYRNTDGLFKKLFVIGPMRDRLIDQLFLQLQCSLLDVA